MSEWRPIQSAPKDGDMILMALGDRIVAASWQPDAYWVGETADNEGFFT